MTDDEQHGNFILPPDGRGYTCEGGEFCREPVLVVCNAEGHEYDYIRNLWCGHALCAEHYRETKRGGSR